MSGRNTQSVQVKVKRYWPGKAPEGANVYSDYSSSDDEAGEKTDEFSKSGKIVNQIEVSTLEEKTDDGLITLENVNPQILQADRRLQRLQISKKIIRPKDLSTRYDQEDEKASEASEDEELEDHRAKIKKEVLLRQQETEKNLEVIQDVPEEESEEEESEYSSESSEEEDRMPMFKPVFVPKSQRITIIEKERKEAEQAEAERLRDLEKQLRKKESAKMVQELIKQELEEATFKALAITEADDTDGLNEEAEYEAWKLRELTRIKRDVEEKAAIAREQAELERRRNLTEEERIREDLEKVRQQDEAKFERQQNTNQVFLQKYHHKGAFFMDKDEDIYKRNFHEATESEVFHRELLPKVMQVKNFGLAGRTKYTHLGDQDTTSDSPWNQYDPSFKSTLKKLGGLHDMIEHKVYKAPKRDNPEENNYLGPPEKTNYQGFPGNNNYQGFSGNNNYQGLAGTNNYQGPPGKNNYQGPPGRNSYQGPPEKRFKDQ